MRFAAAVPAAGLSKRMGAFKPLLDVNGFPMVRMTVNAFKNAGVSDIVCVTGLRSGEVCSALEGSGAKTVFNAEYETTDMLRSVQLALKALPEADGVFILPGDMPLVSPALIFHMMAEFEKEPAAALCPYYEGRSAHPLLLSRETAGAALSYGGEGGLQGLLASVTVRHISGGTPGAMMDADTPEAYAGVCKYARLFRGVSREVCLALLEKAETPAHIKRHCLAVAELSEHMAEELDRRGFCIDAQLAFSGGAVHDIKRLKPEHHLAGADFLRAEGYAALADIAAQHYGFVGGDIPAFSEWSVVCLADKLVRETERVSIDERYAPSCLKFPADTYIGRRIRTSIKICNEMCRRYERITGEKLQ